MEVLWLQDRSVTAFLVALSKSAYLEPLAMPCCYMQRNLLNFFAFFSTMLALAPTESAEGSVEMMTSTAGTKLLQLAKDHFGNDIQPAEEKLFRAAANGEEADCSEALGDEIDPAQVAKWRIGRVIRANRLQCLCADPMAVALVSSRGISIRGARID
jgi:hypothetical protein